MQSWRVEASARPATSVNVHAVVVSARAEGPRASASLNALHQRGQNKGTEKGEIMLKKILFATMFLGVLSASALSVRQLKTGTQHILACGSSCVRTDFCQKPCYCFFSDPQVPPAFASRKARRSNDRPKWVASDQGGKQKWRRSAPLTSAPCASIPVIGFLCGCIRADPR